MHRRKKLLLLWFFFTLLIAISGVSTLFLFFHQLSPDNQKTFIHIVYPFRFYFILPSLIFFIGISYATKWVVDSFLIPLAQLDEELRLLIDANPSGRIAPKGHPLVQSLIHSINYGAEKTETLLNQVNQQIEFAKSDLEKENSVLAILIEEIKEGVIVCNREGSILLYNKKAHSLFSDHAQETSTSKSAYIGIGRSIFQLIESSLLEDTIEELNERHRNKESNLTQHFTNRSGNLLLDIEVIGLLDRKETLNGFIFVIQDLTANMSYLKPFENILHDFKEKIRSPLANIRSTIETLIDYPVVSQEQRTTFLDIIQQQSVELSSLLDSSLFSSLEHCHIASFLEQISLSDWLHSLQRKVKTETGLSIELSLNGCDGWVNIKRYFMSQALLHIIARLNTELAANSFRIELREKGKFALVELNWNGKGLEPESFQEWIVEPLPRDSEDAPISLSEILRYHDAEIWFQNDLSTKKNYLRLFLPKIEMEKTPDIVDKSVVLKERPLFYDFNLFDKAIQHPELNDIRLSEISYTVFDTETTGLNPSAGDEIISIGAVRIVNGRMLPNEMFEQLINPKRTIPQASIKIHGIHPEQLIDQPTIETVLPQFAQFVDKTVLVAHNAAFDMKFLQLKERDTGVAFKNSVLDTLMLSALAHPYQDSHSLDEIAHRFNIEIRGRHTALGDAMVTGELLLKLIPLLAEKGIVTLKQAIQTSKKTYYARLHY